LSGVERLHLVSSAAGDHAASSRAGGEASRRRTRRCSARHGGDDYLRRGRRIHSCADYFSVTRRSRRRVRRASGLAIGPAPERCSRGRRRTALLSVGRLGARLALEDLRTYKAEEGRRLRHANGDPAARGRVSSRRRSRATASSEGRGDHKPLPAVAVRAAETRGLQTSRIGWPDLKRALDDRSPLVLETSTPTRRSSAGADRSRAQVRAGEEDGDPQGARGSLAAFRRCIRSAAGRDEGQVQMGTARRGAGEMMEEDAARTTEGAGPATSAGSGAADAEGDAGTSRAAGIWR